MSFLALSKPEDGLVRIAPDSRRSSIRARKGLSRKPALIVWTDVIEPAKSNNTRSLSSLNSPLILASFLGGRHSTTCPFFNPAATTLPRPEFIPFSSLFLSRPIGLAHSIIVCEARGGGKPGLWHTCRSIGRALRATRIFFRILFLARALQMGMLSFNPST